MAVTTHIAGVGGTNNQPGLLHLPRWGKPSRAIMCFHGHGGSEYQMQQGLAWAGHPEYWADNGYAVLGINTGDQWLSSNAMQSGTDAYNWLVAQGYAAAGAKIGVAGWSMGGGHALRWTLENPSKVAAAVTFSPASDLDYAEAQAGWTAEIDALYGASHSTYLTQGSSRSPKNNVASYRGGPKILVIHPTDDPTLPYSMNGGAGGFVALVNNPSVTLRQPDITGGHQGGLLNVAPRETWEFFRTRWGT